MAEGDSFAHKSIQTPTFIDLFAGCGGLSLGLMKAGWKGLFAIEKDPLAFETLTHNLLSDGTYSYAWPDWLPKKNIPVGKFLRQHRTHIARLRGLVDLIAGGPPCQGFSYAGQRDRNDSRNTMFRHYVDVVRLVQPPFLLLENVKGIASEFGKKERANRRSRVGRPAKAFSQRIREKLEANGYRIFSGLVRAVDVGVPQLRPRYILIGIREDFLARGPGVDPFARGLSHGKAFSPYRLWPATVICRGSV